MFFDRLRFISQQLPKENGNCYGVQRCTYPLANGVLGPRTLFSTLRYPGIRELQDTRVSDGERRPSRPLSSFALRNNRRVGSRRGRINRPHLRSPLLASPRAYSRLLARREGPDWPEIGFLARELRSAADFLRSPFPRQMPSPRERVLPVTPIYHRVSVALQRKEQREKAENRIFPSEPRAAINYSTGFTRFPSRLF